MVCRKKETKVVCMKKGDKEKEECMGGEWRRKDALEKEREGERR